MISANELWEKYLSANPSAASLYARYSHLPLEPSPYYEKVVYRFDGALTYQIQNSKGLLREYSTGSFWNDLNGDPPNTNGVFIGEFQYGVLPSLTPNSSTAVNIGALVYEGSLIPSVPNPFHTWQSGNENPYRATFALSHVVYAFGGLSGTMGAYYQLQGFWLELG